MSPSPTVLPTDWSTALTVVEVGRNTTEPSATVPVASTPRPCCQALTIALVAESNTLSIVTVWFGSYPRATRLASNWPMSAPSSDDVDNDRHAGSAPSRATTGAPSTVYRTSPAWIAVLVAMIEVMVWVIRALDAAAAVGVVPDTEPPLRLAPDGSR